MNDNHLILAYSMHKNPKIYALLLGSGISRAAGIKTGFEILEDLIRQLAEMKGYRDITDPFDWYMTEYREDPSYDALVERLGKTSFERQSILKGYFEGSDDSLKQPTDAHRAIASLVKSEHIQVILTTNFDRLLEKAIEDEQIVPDVISTVDMIDGTRPVQFTDVTIIKLHGDYKDGRIRNTSQELDEYEDKQNLLLDRILNEYGLIVCGWSAEYDKALQKAFKRVTQERFATYWTAFNNDVKDDAKAIIASRRADIVPITGANQFFLELQQNVFALDKRNASHPLTIPLAVERTKKLLSASNFQIELEDLLVDESKKVIAKITSEEYVRKLRSFAWGNKSDLRDIFKFCYQEMDLLLNIAKTICWYGDGRLSNRISEIVTALAATSTQLYASFIPTLLYMYTCGIAACSNRNWVYLFAVTAQPQVPMVIRYKDNYDSVLEFLIRALYMPTFNKEYAYDMPGFILDRLMADLFAQNTLSTDSYDNAFDLFELMLNIILFDLHPEETIVMLPVLHFTRDRSWRYFENFVYQLGKYGDPELLNQFRRNRLVDHFSWYTQSVKKYRERINSYDLSTFPDLKAKYMESRPNFEIHATTKRYL